MRVKELFVFEGLGKKSVYEVRSGDLFAVVGLDDFEIGDRLSDMDIPESLKRIQVEEPTISMMFTINDSPFFGKEGKFVTSRHLRERLNKETEINLALRVEDTDKEDTFIVNGRGILHLSVLIETMRREGYELQVGKPKVIFKTIDGIQHEPIENLVVDVPEHFSDKVIELVTQRKGELKIMQSKGHIQHPEFEILTRGIIGLRNLVLTATSGEAVMNHRLHGYAPIVEGIPTRHNGSIVSSETGQALAYSLDRLQDRGKFFIEPGEHV